MSVRAVLSPPPRTLAKFLGQDLHNVTIHHPQAGAKNPLPRVLCSLLRLVFPRRVSSIPAERLELRQITPSTSS